VLLSEVNRNPGKIRAWLISMDGDEPDHILTEDAYRIGKSDQVCDIVLPSQAVSRLHAKLIWSGDTYLLRDMRSRKCHLY
jgi:predicted component of type VI protein secretion system